MRAAPGFLPRAITLKSQRIDIALPSNGVPRVANNGEGGVNPGTATGVLTGRPRPGKGFATLSRLRPVLEIAADTRRELRCHFEDSATIALRTFVSSASAAPCTLGNARSSRSRASIIVSATIRRANGLLSAGITCQRAHA